MSICQLYLNKARKKEEKICKHTTINSANIKLIVTGPHFEMLEPIKK